MEPKKPETGKPTLSRLKEEARATKKSRGITHTQALEAVAKAHGFANWHAATKQLEHGRSAVREEAGEGGEAGARKGLLDGIPEITDPVFIRAYEAIYADEEKCPLDLKTATMQEVFAWEQEQEKKAAARGRNLISERMCRSTALNMVVNTMHSGQLSEAEFEALLIECSTYEGCLAMMERSVRGAQEPDRRARMRQMERQREPGLRSSGGVDIAGLMSARRPTGPGPLAAEYAEAHRGNDEWPTLELSQCDVYECAWGFVAEQRGQMLWDFVVPELWREDVMPRDKLIDRFLTAWKNDGEPARDMAKGQLGDGVLIMMDDGISQGSCMTLWVSGRSRRDVEMGRRWVVGEFIANIWPKVMARALDPEYVFEADWQTY